jgi:hypothetical protein
MTDHPFILLSEREIEKLAETRSLIAWQVYSLLLCYRNRRSGQCNPSLATLSERTGFPERSIRRVFPTLKKHGLIVRQFKDGKTTQYDFPLREEWQKFMRPRTPMTGGEDMEVPPGEDIQVPQNQKKIEPEERTRVPNGTGTKGPNPQVDEVMLALQEKLEGMPMDGSREMNRRYAWNLLAKAGKALASHGQDKARAPALVKQVIEAAFADPFHASKATSMRYLFNNSTKIINERRKAVPNLVKI